MVLEGQAPPNTIDFCEIESSISCGVNLYAADLTREFDSYLTQALMCLQRDAVMDDDLRMLDDTLKKSEKASFYERRNKLQELLQARVTEIGSRYSRRPARTFSNKQHLLTSPEMNLSTSSVDSALDLGAFRKVLSLRESSDSREFLKAVMQHPQFLLFVCFNSVLRVFKSGLSRKGSLLDSQTANIFLDSRTFAQLFFFLQLFGFETMNVGSKFLQSKHHYI